MCVSIAAAPAFLLCSFLLIQFDAFSDFIAILCLADGATLHHLFLLFNRFVQQSLRDTIKGIFDAFAVDSCCFLVGDRPIGSAPVHNLT